MFGDYCRSVLKVRNALLSFSMWRQHGKMHAYADTSANKERDHAQLQQVVAFDLYTEFPLMQWHRGLNIIAYGLWI